VFISYSHVDRIWVERLQRMMAPLLRATGQELRLWDDSQIEDGRPWRPAIEAALAEAKVALLLVSDAFLASEFVINEELPALLAAAKAEGVPILWASVGPCHVEVTEIYHYQAVLSPSRHLKAMDEVELAEALKTITLAIREAALAALKPVLPEAVPPPSAPDGPRTSGSGLSVAGASGPAEAVGTPAARAPGGRKSAVFWVKSALVRRSGGGWEVVERRDVEVRGWQVDLGDGVDLPLIELPAGELVMGSPADEEERDSDEGPLHRVRLERFLIGQRPITQAQWRAVARQVPPLGQSWQLELALNPSRFSDQPDSAQRPVEQVSWHDASEFCRRLSVLSGDNYTLPSEAQWEYACRAGTTTPFAFGEMITPELANYDGTSRYANGPEGLNRGQTTPVGMFPANAWGLQDMHGNVWEWCLDHWHGGYAGAPFDGSAWVSGGDQDRRLLRGGSWFFLPRYCRSAYRSLARPVDRLNFLGFRVCCLPQGRFLNA
jgi:formylglycine-generating enzyme required for sulfatase activity